MRTNSLGPDVAALIDVCEATRGLDAGARAALAQLLESPLCFVPVSALGKDERKPLEAFLLAHHVPADVVAGWVKGLKVAAEVLDALVAEGWLAYWKPTGRTPMAVLTPLAAERLGVELKEIDETSEAAAYWSLPDPNPRRPIVLPPGYKTRRLPTWASEVFAAPDPGPVDEAIAAEEFLMREAVAADGRLDVDPETGKVKMEPVLLFGMKLPIERLKRRRRTVA